MADIARKTDPKLWDEVKERVTRSSKGGRPGQWSARKAQIATQEYKKDGGGYEGRKSADNHLAEWTEEEWGTRSGGKSTETGERYLPKQARKSLSKAEYERSSKKKRADTAEGRQFSRQPADVARKAAAARRHGHAGPTKAALMERARAEGLRGRSRMSKAELEKALG